MKRTARCLMFGLVALAAACGQPEEIDATGLAAKQQALTAGPGDIVRQIQDATAKLQAATRQLNDLVAGAYASWPSRDEFRRSNTIRGYKNDLQALNAVTLVAGAYIAGSYISPILELESREFTAGAYDASLMQKVSREYSE